MVTYLGKLCKHEHDYLNTGFSLRSEKTGACAECAKYQRAQSNKRNKEKRKLYYSQWYAKNQDHIKEYNDGRREEVGEWHKKHNTKPEIKEKRRERDRKKRENPSFRLYQSMSSGVSLSLKGNKGGRKWERLIGYTLDELQNHLEDLWEPWMSWSNYGNPHKRGCKTWVIDHIKPKDAFKFSSEIDKEFKECWSLENLQPKEWVENIKKSNKYEWSVGTDMIKNPKNFIEEHFQLSQFSKFSPNGVDFSIKEVKGLRGCGCVGIEKTTLPEYFLISPNNQDEYFLEPGAYSLTLNEGGKIPQGYCGMFQSRSSLARNGAFIESGLFDTGFETSNFGVMLMVYNTLGIKIIKNARIAQLLLFEAEEAELYNGQFQGNKDKK